MSEPSIPKLPLERIDHNIGDIPGDFQAVIRGGHLFVMPRLYFILSLERIEDSAAFLALVERSPEKFLALAWNVNQIKAAGVMLRAQLLESSAASNPRVDVRPLAGADDDLDWG